MSKLTNHLAMLLFVPLVCCLCAADDAEPKEQVTLMGMLLEWRYPEAKFNGAESSDAAVEGISSIKSKAILTTPDSVENSDGLLSQEIER